MYFDPLTTWLVALLADGFLLANEKGSDAQTRMYYEKKSKETNVRLNCDLRRLLGDSKRLSDLQITNIRNYLEMYRKQFEYRYGTMELDTDVQERMLSLFTNYITEHKKILEEHEETYNYKISRGQNVSYVEKRIERESKELIFCQQVVTAVEQYRKSKEAEVSTHPPSSKNDIITVGCCGLFVTLIVIIFAIIFS